MEEGGASLAAGGGVVLSIFVLIALGTPSSKSVIDRTNSEAAPKLDKENSLKSQKPTPSVWPVAMAAWQYHLNISIRSEELLVFNSLRL